MRKSGFTILELMTVMIIIALLASLGTPVFLAARENANRNKDISSLNAIRTSLQLYYTDRGEYPTVLYGCVTQYNQIGKLATLPPRSNIQYGLYPKRINSTENFRSEKLKVPVNEEERTLVAARYPAKPSGKNKLNTQAFGPDDGFVNIGIKLNSADRSLPKSEKDLNATKFFKFSAVDVGEVQRNNTKVFELRYTKFWTKWGLGGGNSQDDPRQLGYAYPPDDTVVTWNSYYRKYQNGVPTADSKDLVLFLTGAVKQVPSSKVIAKAWTLKPTD